MRKILVSGHRGYRALETENTRNAFQRAIDMGLDYIEFDVKKTADGIPVIFHDRYIDRLMNGKGNIESYSLAELRKIGYKDGQKIQTLEEMVEQCAGRINLMLEIKTNAIASKIMGLIRKFKIEDSVLIQSFFLKHLKSCHREYNDPRIKWGLCQAFLGNFGPIGSKLGLNSIGGRYIYRKFLKPYPFITYLNVDGPFISDEYMDLVNSHGFHIILGANHTWEYIDRYKAWDVEIINCDDPKFCVERILEEKPDSFSFSESIKSRLLKKQ